MQAAIIVVIALAVLFVVVLFIRNMRDKQKFTANQTDDPVEEARAEQQHGTEEL